MKKFLYTFLACFIFPITIMCAILYGFLYLIQLLCRTINIYLEKGMRYIDKHITSNL